MKDHTTPAKKPKKRNTQKGRPGFLKNPCETRDGETIGGGYIVFRRGGRSGRVRCPEWPFEHPTYESATTERDRLAGKYPGETFQVFCATGPVREEA